MTTDAPGTLHAWLRQRIAADGPMPVADVMRACLMHSDFGYYRGKQAIGATGDFITAPEISQVFGELIGVWVAACWQALGEPKRWRLIELGPGRGTLMADLLRALRVLPGARAGLDVVLVEANRLLTVHQRAVLAPGGVAVSWLDDTAGLAALAPLPTVLIANEFLDALPIRQQVALGGRWHERCVGMAESLRGLPPNLALPHKGGGDGVEVWAGVQAKAKAHRSPLRGEGRSGSGGGERTLPIEFVAGSTPGDPCTAPDGAIREIMSGAMDLIADLAAHHKAPAYHLYIDYGHVGPVLGDTLQAVRNHRYADPLAMAGEADLSAHVDFAQVIEAARASGFEAYGPIGQAEFLGRLGAVERLARLTQGKGAASANQLQTGLARLMDPHGMGSRFKAVSFTSKGLASPPVF